MYRYEVLAPAGELNAIIPLIEAGENAIYVGLEGFSSRPQSADFTMKDIVVATQICHNTKNFIVYLTDSIPSLENIFR